MADSTDPKKETVRIPVQPARSPSPSDSVRINLPARPRSNGLTRHAVDSPKAHSHVPMSPRPSFSQDAIPSLSAKSPFLPPVSPEAASSNLRPASLSSRTGQAAAVQPSIERALSPGPKKETARISVLADPPKAAGSKQMKKTQPLFTMPEGTGRATPVDVAAPQLRARSDEIPMPLCWTLLGISTAILLIQIWNYLS